MDFKLDIYELGKLLENIMKNYDVSILAKIKLSGGWFTITGKVALDYAPEGKSALKGNNIIGLKIISHNGNYSNIKITGINDKKFNVNIASTQYKEVKLVGININKLKTDETECKLRIDENIIFTIKTSSDEIVSLISNL